MTDKPGRPTKYKSENAKIAKAMVKLGATEVDLAEFFEVCVNTIDNWKYQHSDFLGALKSARDNYDDRIEEALAKRALGYSHKETKVHVCDGVPVETEVIKHYPPDAGAAKMWLSCRRRNKWSALAVEDDDAPEPTKVVIQVQDARRKDNDE